MWINVEKRTIWYNTTIVYLKLDYELKFVIINGNNIQLRKLEELYNQMNAN